MKKSLLTLALFALVGNMAVAQNPLIKDHFNADPSALVVGDRVYVFPSHDIPAPWDYARKDWFCMADYHVYSSDNLIDWVDHGMILDQKDVPWGNPTAYSMWAPCCIEKDGKYYFYFPNASKTGGFTVGVAIADHPEGPYEVMPEPIEGIGGIDPCVLKASDGNHYIFWGAGRCAKLADNMIELAEDNPVETMKWGNREMKNIGVNCLSGLPSRQAEGPFAFERNGYYYLTYPYVREDTEVLGYAMSKNPMGPYEYKGLIMEEHENGCWTNHHSIIEFKGQWYLFYHHNDYSPDFDKNRSMRVDSLFFNEDGTIALVKPTERGVGITNSKSEIHIDRYSELSASGDSIAYLDLGNYFKGWKTVFYEKGAWAQYNTVQFDKAPKSVKVQIVPPSAGTLEILQDDKVIATVNVPKDRQVITATAKVTGASKGLHHIKVRMASEGKVQVDWLTFE
ncbi:MAG: family 43 glycosylhydrolase [Bacteroidaceae bacterium]|nr:family 43 glycosylhydrolase [Bacteroidaceae bacterium]